MFGQRISSKIYTESIDSDKVQTLSSYEQQGDNSVNALLQFQNKSDNKNYALSQQRQFNFFTFAPTIALFVCFQVFQFHNRDFLDESYMTLSYLISLSSFAVLGLLVVGHSLVSWQESIQNCCALRIISLLTDQGLFGKLGSLVILLFAVSEGFKIMSLAGTDACVDNALYLELVECTAAGKEEERNKPFPLAAFSMSFAMLIFLPIYLKSVNRYAVLLSCAIMTGFVVYSLLADKFQFDPYIVLYLLFFFSTIYELERQKMATYLATKEDLRSEHTKLKAATEKQQVLERKLNMALVHQILPPKVAESIRRGETVQPESFDQVTIFFSDVVGFTNICAKVAPIKVVQMLNDLYTVMDFCTSHFPLYKVETIGDAYMIVGGLPVTHPNHAQQVADFALIVSQAVHTAVKSPIDGSPIQIRIGIHSGPCMAGVVGNLMPRYCLFGDTVNTASRMESNGEKGRIHLSEATAQILINSGKYNVSSRGEMDIKGKGKMNTYWLDSACEHNVNSNQLAVEKIELRVLEVLAASYEEDEHSARASSNGSPSMSSKRRPPNTRSSGSLSPIPRSESYAAIQAKIKEHQNHAKKTLLDQIKAKTASAFHSDNFQQLDSKVEGDYEEDEKEYDEETGGKQSNRIEMDPDSGGLSLFHKPGMKASHSTMSTQRQSSASASHSSRKGGMYAPSGEGVAVEQQQFSLKASGSERSDKSLGSLSGALYSGRVSGRMLEPILSAKTGQSSSCLSPRSAIGSPRTPGGGGGGTLLNDGKGGFSFSPQDLEEAARLNHQKSTNNLNSSHSHSHGIVSPRTARSGSATPNGSPSLRAHHSVNFSTKYNLNVPIEGEDFEYSKGAKLLVVEDSLVQQKLLGKLLEEADPTWDIEYANDGEQALMMIKAAKMRYDVVWVDETLSDDANGLNGHELVEVMRKKFHMKSCVVVACTALPDESGEVLKTAGVDHIWPKPAPSASVIKITIEQLIMEKLRRSGKISRRSTIDMD